MKSKRETAPSPGADANAAIVFVGSIFQMAIPRGEVYYGYVTIMRAKLR